MIDPFLISTVVLGAATGGLIVRQALMKVDHGNELRARLNAEGIARSLAAKVARHEAAADKLHAQRVAAGKKGTAASAAARIAKREQEAAEAPARAERTIAALRSSPPRPREQVVAPVTRKRAAEKKASAAT